MGFSVEEAKEIAESLKESIINLHKIVVEGNKNENQRYIWYVAISGFLLFNSLKLISENFGYISSPIILRLLILVWMISAIVSILSLLFLNRLNFKDNKYYVSRIADINSFILFQEKKENLDLELLKLIDEQDEDIIKLKKDVEGFQKWVEFFEIISNVSLLVAVFVTGFIFIFNI